MPGPMVKQTSVLEYLKKQPIGHWTAPVHVSSRLGCSEGAASRHLRALWQRGLAIRQSMGFGVAKVYQVKRNANGDVRL